jgi:hypothetical protein
MSGFESSDFFKRRFEEYIFPLPPSSENLALVREFLLEKWRERYVERHNDNLRAGIETDFVLPFDLSNSCKFTALFGSVVFDGEITGNYDHIFNMVDGKKVDINKTAADVISNPKAHRVDKRFLAFNEDLYESLKSCVPRVESWIDEFGRKMELTQEAAPIMEAGPAI